ncbi:hypothetical protein [Vibrio paucivorans]|uniref:ABC transporter n=1 Tax=Vibrio paucivorans TaxID=2829489 RepID=A0A9X3HTR0_9VIBR|nr:hypothetical protein [Vibrio paucivorans]MCW8335846.1 hypothetical protein [Vibrio paucivorans]
MHPSIHMLEKEWLEHKLVTRVPLFILLCGVVLFVSLLMNSNLQHNLFFQMEFSGDVSDVHLEFGDDLNALILGGTGFISILLSSLYFPKTLRKERMEGSSMFWRSMPVSDLATHGVKLAFGLAMIPLITSVLVVSADFFLWLLNIASENQLALLFKQQSLSYVLLHWMEFIVRMLLVGVALFPFATIAMAVSQKVKSPILVMVLGWYAIKWMSVGVLGIYVVSDFMQLIVSLPFKVLASPNPLSAFSDMGVAPLLVYMLIGGAGLFVSLRFSRTVE